MLKYVPAHKMSIDWFSLPILTPKSTFLTFMLKLGYFSKITKIFSAPSHKTTKVQDSLECLRTEVRGDFNIHGTNFFDNAVFHQKSKKYDVVSLPVPLVGQKIRPPREILTWLFIIEKA